MAKIQVNGIQLEYDVRGEGPALLFIHGLGGCMQDWEFQAQAFSRQYKVIRFDLRGHGGSDKPAGPYSMQMFAADAAGLLQALGIASAHVAGISLGGGVAFQLTLDHPALVKTLTVVNSGPEAVIRTFKEKMLVKLRFYLVRKMGIPKFGATIAKKLFPKAEHKAQRDAFAANFAKNDLQAYLEAQHALFGWTVTERIGAIRCPVLAIAADRDYTPVSFKEMYVARIPDAKLEIVADSHHALPAERPDAFNAVLGKFLGQRQVTGSGHAPVGQEFLQRA